MSSLALKSFISNSNRLIAPLELVKEVSERANAEADALMRQSPTLGATDQGYREKITKMEAIKSLVMRAGEVLNIQTEWICVMLVTYTETFLEDALTHYGGLDPALMGNCEPKITYSEMKAVSSLEELAVEMRRQWARKSWVDDGGPSKWVERFGKEGASGLRDFQVKPMEELWGIRHMLVHRTGRPSRAFKERHPDVPLDSDGRIMLKPSAVGQYISVVQTFVTEVDAFLQERQDGRARRGTETPGTSME